ncbi:MAG TPA: ABC transporter substrate-binding protein [Stellaceae bacterium]|nr:ABC transporter substrate-binding protein [Stellaceae bacterium]
MSHRDFLHPCGNIRPWLGLAAIAASLLAQPAIAADFRWAGAANVQSLDPYIAPNSATRAVAGNIYEPLVALDRNMKPAPALATAWKRVSDTVWRFNLRKNVRFQDGSAFTAEDVVYSFHRATTGSSLIKGQLSIVAEVRVIDDTTVDIVSVRPDPLLPQGLAGWLIMPSDWTPKHDPARQTDGTGPFVLVEHKAGEHTVLARNPLWWGHPDSLLNRAIYLPIQDEKKRVAALLQGKVDLIQGVAPGDVGQIDQAQGLKILSAPLLRTVMLGFDQSRPILPDQPPKKQNPFKDLRVRKAVALAIDEGQIIDKVMHGFARPAGLIIGPGVVGFAPQLDKRPPYDPAVARTLMAEAGYAKGFSVTFDCPWGRYVNDHTICEAIVPMLDAIGIHAKLKFWPTTGYREHIGPPDYNTQFFLLGWTAASDDVLGSLIALAATRAPAQQTGLFNIGGFSYPAIDQLINQIESEPVPEKRQLLVNQALTFIKNSVLYVPLHQEVVIWAARDAVQTQALANGEMPLRYVKMGAPALTDAPETRGAKTGP